MPFQMKDDATLARLDVNDLRREKKAALDEVKRLEAEISSADCDLTEDQKEKRVALADSILDYAEGCENKAKAIEEDEEASRRRAERMATLAAAGASGGGRRTTTVDSGLTAKGGDVEVGEPQFVNDPKKGFGDHREFLSAVIAEPNAPQNASDERLRYLATAGTDEHVKGSDPYGGFLTPTGLSPTIEMIPSEEDPFAGRTRPLPMDALKVEVNARVDKNHSTSVSGGLTVSRKAETAAASSSRMQFEQVKFEANSLFGFAYASEELLRASPTSFAAILEDGFRDEFRSNHVKELLRGTGVGEPEGIHNCPALVTVSKETGQDADSIVYENIINMRARCWRYSQAIWLYNHDALPQLMTLVLPIGTGGVPMWQMSALEGEPDRLLGRPAIPSEYMSTIGDLHDIDLVVPSEIREGTYQPLQSAESMHVRFDRHERAFKFWTMNDAKSLWRTALTPEQSSKTLSPFVALAARA